MKEIKVIIPLEKGYGETIKQIEGELDCIIINTPGRTRMVIESELGYNIYTSNELIGVVYVPISVQTQDSQGHRISFSNSKYLLNEKIKIRLQNYGYVKYYGNMEKQQIKLIIRLK